MTTRNVTSRNAALSMRNSRVSRALDDRPIDLTRPFAITDVRLSGVRGFRKLDLSLKAPARPRHGQWVVLLGDNGVGKTTILRALALALAPADVVPSVLSRTGLVSPTVRAGATEAEIEVDAPSHNVATILRIESSKGGDRLRAHDFAPSERGERLRDYGIANHSVPFLVAYGSRRGSGLTGSERVTESPREAAVETLFDEGANLIQPDEWLKGWQLAALQGGPDSQDARFFNAILSTLCALLPDVGHIHVSREAVEVEGPTLGRIPLGALSDGYRTTMGWVLDMIARWVEEAKRQNVPIDEDFHKRMAGVALIDEIDLHLHPRWQRDVIDMVRGHFPRMSFVVTTHNPLTLLGAKPGEIHILRRTEKGDVEVIQRDLPPGAGAEQVLTGDWFGLASTLDKDTLGMLARHQRLILDKGLNSPEAMKMESELRRRLGSYADTSIERLAREAAAKVLDEDALSLTPEQRRKARDKVVEMLRESVALKRPVKAKPATAKPRAKPRRAKRA
jgi:energy-coupling factor transporter ATP-binding protein EcfA2